MNCKRKYRQRTVTAASGKPGPRSNRGAALVVALLISTLVAVFAIRMANNYQLNVRRASNQILSDQATLYALSAESIAKQLLMANEDDGNDFDHASEPWGATYPPVPIGSGMLAAEQLVDLQGRFNLNSLRRQKQRDSNDPTGVDPYTNAQEMFIRLLQTFPAAEIDRQRARDIADAVIDWVDRDDSPRGIEGAENSYYQNLDIPYRAANVPMQSVSELRLVKGIDGLLFRLLEPHVAVLSEDVQTININTASDNILRALGWTDAERLEPLGSSDIETDLAAGEDSIGMSKTSFLEVSPWDSLVTQSKLDEGLIEAHSKYFALTSHAKLGELTLPMRTVFKVESSSKVLVLSRSTGSL